MSPWERLTPLLGANELRLILVLLVAALVLRQLLRGGARRRGTVAVAILGAAALLHLLPIAGSGPLALIASTLVATGAVILVALVVFDLVLARANLRVPSIVRELLQAVTLFLVLLVLLRRSGVDLVSLVTTSAVLTAVIGFALQSTIASIFAGVALQLDDSIRIGEWIRIGEREGQITEIRWRSTLLLARDGSTIVVPNADLVSHHVINFSKLPGKHRLTIDVGLHYRHPPRQVHRVLLDAIRGAPGVLASPSPDCLTASFGDSAVGYQLRFWTSDFLREEQTRAEVCLRVWYAAHRAGLEIPYPIRTLVGAPEPAAIEREHELAARTQAVARVAVFSCLDETDRAALAAAMRPALFAEGEEIIREGDPGDSLFIIQHGHVEVLSGDGRCDVARLGPGDVFGEMSLMTGDRRNATCLALSDVACWVIDHRPVRRLLGTRPRLAEEIAPLLARRQRELQGVRDQAAAAPAETQRQLLARIKQFFHLD
jgi:small-conductance mechanosensitive channel/CRP-like cAMP-binding protein